MIGERTCLLFVVIQSFLIAELCVAQSWWEGCIFGQDECPNEHIQFWLYKNGSQGVPLQLDPLNLTANSFEPKLQLRLLLHGFHGNRDTAPNSDVRPALLGAANVHVISVDYGRLAQFPCYYPWAVYNAALVGKCVAQLVDNLVASRIYESSDIHLIGFSLGAQIAGLTANYARFRLDRITGLDPAGPGFLTNDMAERLDASDAEFVDVIHTDPVLYGLITPSGHADFYPNFENIVQPGCSYWEESRIYNCNHFRAPAYYAESITTKTGFWSYNCGDWIEFVLKQCENYVAIPNALMGYYIPRSAAGAYFLNTNPKYPYAKGPLVIYEFEVIENK